MNTSVKGRRIHGLAEESREKGRFVQALKYTDEAMVKYQCDGDELGFAEVLASRFLTLRHLFEKTGDIKFQILAKHSAMSSVEIAKRLNEKQAVVLPLYNLAKVQEDLGELDAAISSYKESVGMAGDLPVMHNRVGVVADMKVHMGICEYKNGDEGALGRVTQALSDLINSDEPSYNKNVWTSGAHMKIAETVFATNQPLAKEHLDKARKIIEGDDRLIIRKEQLKRLCDRMKI